MSQAAELLQARAEVVKLARALGRDPDQLSYLERLSPDDLRRLLPAGLTATIGQRAFGPLLSARLAGLLDTDAILVAVVEHDLWAEALLIAEHDDALQERVAAAQLTAGRPTSGTGRRRRR